ncbi:MAG: efflux RND transporter periplasmic adaptor subunit [Polyangiaceae bacterium]|nr:efflux RND transporter periplasmic adaptor subunit [Polyangiaceae bacterium]
MRYVVAIAGLLLVIGALVFIKFQQISMLIGFGQAMEKAGPPPEAVATSLADQQAWEQTVSTIGTVTSMKSVTISAETPGVVSKILFESGALVKQGDVLVELDTSVERAQVAQVQVRRDLAAVTARRTRALGKEGVAPSAQVDQDDSQLKSADAELALLYAQIRRKSVRAPFSGKLGIRTVDLGQYINPGTAMTTLESVEGTFVDFTLPQQQAVEVGMKVRVAIDGAPDAAAEGTIAAIDTSVDESSRSIKLRASVPNKDNKLRPGMFANVTVLLPTSGQSVVVPATSIVHAPYGDSVFVIQDVEGGTDAKGPNGEPVLEVRQQFVRVGQRRGDFVAVLDGVKSGEKLVSAGAFKLRNKARIFVNDALAAKSELNPKPENH